MERAPRSLNALTLAGVGVRVAEHTLLQDIDLTLRAGELVGLIGPSGAGKSTLIRVLLGNRAASSGAVTADGGPLSGVGPVGYVPQDDALHTALTVRDALDYAAQLRLPGLDEAARAAKISQVAAQLSLSERLDLRIKRLSGGQRKRVSVAMELLTEPAVLILDEPTSGLDPGMEAQMMALFADLAAAGRVVLVATHAMASIARCGMLVVLVGGRLAYAGPPEDALRYFEVSEHDAIFRALKAHAPPVWARRWLQAPRPAARALPSPAAPAATSPGSPPAANASPASRESAEARLAALKAQLGKGP